MFPKKKTSFMLAALAVVFIWLSSDALAIPAWARKYKTSCSTCHYAYPKLNAFGKAYKNNGFRYPEGQDPEMRKEDPVSLGSEGYKRVWPDAIWPSDIPGTAPLAIHAFGRFHYAGSDNSTSFEIPHEFELFYGGTFDDKISFFGELELEHAAELAYAFAVQYDFSPGFHLKLGSVGLDASPEGLRLTREHYNVGDFKNQSGTWRLRSGSGGGMEFWGATNGAGGRGGFTYALGIGNGQNDAGNFDMNKSKDFYGRATYKIGGLGEAGGTEGQGGEASAFYVDNSFRLGGFFYNGKALAGSGDEDDFSVIGGDIDLWLNRLNVVATALRMKSDYQGSERTSFAYFTEANYVLYPWLIAYARYEFTDKDTDDDSVEAQKNLIPAVVVMLRANVKFSLEYKLPLDDPSKSKDRFTFQFNFAF